MSIISLPPGDGAPDLAEGSVFFIGNATLLLRYAGFTVLTDPNFIHMHEEVDLGGGITATRQTNPAIDIQDLPLIDLIILSHFHGDHFDQVAQRELDKSIPIITPPEAAGALRERGFTALYPIETWESITVTKDDARLTVTAMPGRHGPPVVSFVLPEVMGSIVEFEASNRELIRFYISGDTLIIDDLKELPERYPDVDVAFLHLGGTTVLGIMVTMGAEQGVEMMRIVDPELAIPIHYNDYDVFKSNLDDFKQAVDAAGLGNRVHYMEHGDTYTFTARR